MDTELWQLLVSSADIFSVTGPRIYWGEAPQGDPLPRVTMHQISLTTHLHMQGASGLETYRVQIDCISEDRPSARILADVVKARLNGHRSGGLRLCLLDAERTETEDAAQGRPARISQDYIINWRPENG